MNSLEREMVVLLTELRACHHAAAVKAEFEAEGARLSEVMRLKDIASRAGVGLTLKIGGCEAVTDMYDAAALGATSIIAPMVETPYALEKFAAAIGRAFPPDARQDLRCYINVETITACRHFDAMLDSPAIGLIDGIVIGRGDLAGSLGLARDGVDRADLLALALDVAAKAKARGLTVVVGGHVTQRSHGFFAAFPPGELDGIETRKVVFTCPSALADLPAALHLAHRFEMRWLENKRAHYGRIQAEDEQRLLAFAELYTEV